MEDRKDYDFYSTDWKFDFSSLPKWDVRDRIPFVYDKFHYLPQSDTLCCLYSITEVRMGWYQCFLAILKNKSDPELVFNINKNITFSADFFTSDNGDIVFLPAYFNDKTTGGIGSAVLIVDVVCEKFSYLKMNGYDPCYKVVNLSDGVFGIESDKVQINDDEQLDNFSKTRIDLSCLDWFDFKDVDILSEMV